MRRWILCWVLSVTLGHAAAAQLLEEVLDFEELEPRCVASQTRSDLGSGPVSVHGLSPRGLTANVAVVVDTAHAAEADLGSNRFHNAIVISRDEPRVWSESDGEFLVGQVSAVNDEDLPGGVLTLDFHQLGPVTFFGLTLLDHDDDVAGLKIYTDSTPAGLAELTPADLHAEKGLVLSWVKNSWLASNYRRVRMSLRDESDDAPGFYLLEVAQTRKPGEPRVLDLRQLRAATKRSRSLVGRELLLPDGIADVSHIEIEMGGSTAVDRIRFRRQGPPPEEAEEGLLERLQTQIELQDQINQSIGDQIQELADQFELDRAEALTLAPEDVPVRAEELLTGLENSLLGEFGEDGTRMAGLLHCPPELRCACPAMRGLRAWTADRIARIRVDLELAAGGPSPSGEPVAQIAALAPGALLATLLPSQAADAGAGREQTFFEVFFEPVTHLLSGVGDAVASLFDPETPKIVLLEDSLEISGTPHPCQAFRLTPKSREYQHVVEGMPAGVARRVPKGLYCVFCQTADGAVHPPSTLDLVDNPEAKPVRIGDEAEVCSASS